MSMERVGDLEARGGRKRGIGADGDARRQAAGDRGVSLFPMIFFR
jgi:hypothetical protein